MKYNVGDIVVVTNQYFDGMRKGTVLRVLGVYPSNTFPYSIGSAALNIVVTKDEIRPATDVEILEYKLTM